MCRITTVRKRFEKRVRDNEGRNAHNLYCRFHLGLRAGIGTGQESRVDPLVVVIDSNKDGIIDVGELRGAPVSIRTLDLNNDGAVSRDEASGREKQNRGGGSRLGGYTVPPPANNVPDHLFNIIVGRLTASTATVRVLFHQSSTVLIQYGERSGSLVTQNGKLLS